MKDRPILFSGPMVLALLRDPSDPLCKVETRRIVKPQPPACIHGERWTFCMASSKRSEVGTFGLGPVDDAGAPVRKGEIARLRCPYGRAGDRLWVRETWRAYVDGWQSGAEYRAGGERKNVTAFNVVDWVTDGKAYANLCFSGGDRHPRHSLKWRPSIHMPRWASRLTLAVESVRVERLHDIDDAGARREGVADREAFRALWETINGAGSWGVNPWVWVVGFRRVTS